jgi:hypothetical protein
MHFRILSLLLAARCFFGLFCDGWLAGGLAGWLAGWLCSDGLVGVLEVAGWPTG